MKDINAALFSQLKAHFCCDQRRIKLIADLIIALLKLNQSSVAQWSKALPGEKELDSKYKQIQRFARFFRFSPRLYCQIIWSL